MLVIIFYTLWWFLLQNPLLFLLKGSVKFFGSAIYHGKVQQFLAETDSGEWQFQVLREIDHPNPPPRPGVAKEAIIVTFNLQRSDFYFFTFGIPIFWAVMLAASGIRRGYREIMLGTIAMAAIETALALGFAEIIAGRSMAQMSDSQGEFSKWCDLFGFNIVVLGAPFTAPFLAAIALNRELRWQIFRWGNPEIPRDGRESGGRKGDFHAASRKRPGGAQRMTRHR